MFVSIIADHQCTLWQTIGIQDWWAQFGWESNMEHFVLAVVGRSWGYCFLAGS
jgi:hypothetical protein